MPPDPEPDPPPVARGPLPAWAVVLAGGSGTRLGLVDKPALRLGSRSLLDIALAAVAPAHTVVVGPPRELGAEVAQTREEPPGGGPAAAVVAGVEYLAAHGRAPAAADPALVVVLAADLPGIDRSSVDLLTAAVVDRRLSGAVLLDPTGRSQYLAGVWRLPDLLGRCRTRPSWHGGRLADLLAPLIGERLPVGRQASADLDTADDAREWGVDLPPR